MKTNVEILSENNVYLEHLAFGAKEWCYKFQLKGYPCFISQHKDKEIAATKLINKLAELGYYFTVN